MRGARAWVGAPRAPQSYARARGCAESAVHRDASIALLLDEFKKVIGSEERRPYAVDGHSGRKFARTAMNFEPRSADGRRVRMRHG